MSGKNFILFILLFSFSVYSQDTKKAEIEIKKLLSETAKHLNSAQNDKSLIAAKKALSISLENNLDSYSARIYNLIGLNFSNSKDFKNADLYYNKSLDFAFKAKNDTIICWVYNNLGNLYSYSKKDAKTGIDYYLKAVEYSKKVDDIEYMYNALNLANTYLEIKDSDKAKFFLNEVEPILEKYPKEYEAHFFYNSLSGGYFDEKKLPITAENFYLKALKVCLAKHPNFLQSNEVEIYKTLSNFYKKNNSYKKAFDYLVKSDSLKQKLFDAERNDNIKILSQEIEKEEVKRELVKVEAEKKIQEQKLANNKIFIILICIIFFASLLFLYFQLKLNRFKTKTNNALLESNEELIIAKEKAEEASIVKSQFVSTISHELRTPLYGVIGITDIIEAEHPELKDTQHLRSLKFSANYLLSLVNDILRVYKFEDNKVTLENNLFNLQDKLETIKDSLVVIANKYHNKIEIEVDENIPDFIIGDTIRLSQILINLMSNSLKFTHRGTVLVTANLKNKVDDLCFIEFKVIDTGVGIPEKYINSVFDKFVQIHRKEDDYQGTGLGLTIVQKLVELFKGTIVLESKEHEGTTVTVTIPFESGENKLTDYINDIEVDLSETKQYYVLVVEDNKINQVVTKKLLENHNFICDIADDGYTAIELIENNTYDAILMDINMPKINGFETTKIIREKGYDVPIIAVTAFEKEEVYSRVIVSGMNDIIAKPFDPKKLFQLIRKYINN